MAEGRRIEQVVNGSESTPTGKHGVGVSAQQACHACACPFLSSLLTPALCWHLFSPIKTLALFRGAAGCSRALTSSDRERLVKGTAVPSRLTLGGSLLLKHKTKQQ